MITNLPGFYANFDIPEEEIQRLKEIAYPNFVSQCLLDQFEMNKRTLLDTGAGSNAELGEYVMKRGGTYVPIDLRREMLAEIKQKFDASDSPFFGIQADIHTLPFMDNQFSYAHLRFVLMHIKPESRKAALQEILRVIKDKVFILKYNWRTLDAEAPSELLVRFKDLSHILMEKAGVEPFMGQKLEELVRETVGEEHYTMARFGRKEGNYADELVLLCDSSAQIALSHLKSKALQKSLERLSFDLRDKDVTFTPPEIVVAVIQKQKSE